VSNSIEQVNTSYKKAIARVLTKTLPDSEIIVSSVLINPDRRSGRVWLKTSPDSIQQILSKRKEIQSMLTNLIKTKFTPKLEFLLEDDYLEQIDSLFNEIKHNEN